MSCLRAKACQATRPPQPSAPLKWQGSQQPTLTLSSLLRLAQTTFLAAHHRCGCMPDGAAAVATTGLDQARCRSCALQIGFEALLMRSPASSQVQSAIGANRALAFDLTAACSGFVVGLVTAAQYIRTGAARNVLVIGADALSRFVDWRDRGVHLLLYRSVLPHIAT